MVRSTSQVCVVRRERTRERVRAGKDVVGGQLIVVLALSGKQER